MAQRAWIFQINTFDVNTDGSSPKMLSLATDTHAKLSNEQSDPEIASIFTSFDPFYQAFRQININYDVIAGNREGDTLAMQNLLDQISTQVRMWEAAVRVVYIEDSPQERAIFPNKRNSFYDGIYEERISAVGSLAQKLSQDPALGGVANQVQSFYNLLLSTRLAQQQEEGGLEQVSDLRENQRTIVADELYGVLGKLMHKFRNDRDQIARFFDLSLVRDSGSTPAGGGGATYNYTTPVPPLPLVGETVTGSINGFTAEVSAIDGVSITVINATGAFVAGEMLTGTGGGRVSVS